jgi:hypothetical protein
MEAKFPYESLLISKGNMASHQTGFHIISALNLHSGRVKHESRPRHAAVNGLPQSLRANAGVLPRSYHDIFV